MKAKPKMKAPKVSVKMDKKVVKIKGGMKKGKKGC
jgi:hypothetical protein